MWTQGTVSTESTEERNSQLLTANSQLLTPMLPTLDLFDKLRQRTATVGVIGLGYVGLQLKNILKLSLTKKEL